MSKTTLKVLAVAGSLHRGSVTRTVINHVAERLRDEGCQVDVLDFDREPLALYNPDTSHKTAEYQKLQERVMASDVIVLGTPDYHGSVSCLLYTSDAADE